MSTHRTAQRREELMGHVSSHTQPIGVKINKWSPRNWIFNVSLKVSLYRWHNPFILIPILKSSVYPLLEKDSKHLSFHSLPCNMEIQHWISWKEPLIERETSQNQHKGETFLSTGVNESSEWKFNLINVLPREKAQRCWPYLRGEGGHMQNRGAFLTEPTFVQDVSNYLLHGLEQTRAPD